MTSLLRADPPIVMVLAAASILMELKLPRSRSMLLQTRFSDQVYPWPPPVVRSDTSCCKAYWTSMMDV